MTVAVCDDKKEIHEEIKCVLKNEGSKLGKKVILNERDHYNCAEDFLKAAYDKNYDVIFMDIELGGMSGIKAIAKLQEETYNSKVVFISNHNNYFKNMVEVGLFAFLEKPIDRNKLIDILKKLIRSMDKEKESFEFTDKNKKYKIAFNKINYLEKVGRKVIISTDEANYEYYGTLKQSLGKINSNIFFMPNSSICINFYKVMKYTRSEIEMNCGKKIAIPDRKRKTIRDMYINMRRNAYLD